MKNKLLFWLAPLVLLGCDSGPKSPRGFQLPDGDSERGKAVFVELQCVACHSVEGTEFPDLGRERAIEVRLGGKAIRVRTYGELVTAVINPSHDLSGKYPVEAVSEDGLSLMADFNQSMTVSQLIDIVAFLQSTYTEFLPKDYDPYFP